MLLLSARCYVVILICLRLLTLLLCLVCIAFSQSDTERSQVDVVMQMLLKAYYTALSDVQYVMETAYSTLKMAMQSSYH